MADRLTDPLSSLKLTEFEDTEFLHRLEDLADPDGWTTTEDLAKALRIDADKPTRNVGCRLGWLHRFGVVENDDGKPRWRLTDLGQDLIHGQLTATQARALEELSDGRLLAATRRLSGSLGASSYATSSMMHRQWRYGLAQRKR